jgi:phosphoribosyl 1,2-cyclic phosphate phosphodiesterase
MNFTFLGTGTSHGVPMIGCDCDVCRSTEPKNKRRRCSLYIVTEGLHLIIDTPPDFRDQVLTFGVKAVNAVFLTHPHADHILGFDDIRRFSTLQKEHIPVYASPDTMSMMRKIFHYVDKGYNFQSVPRVQFKELQETVSVGNVQITPLPVHHGPDMIYGYLVSGDNKRLAYIPDCNRIPQETMKLLCDLDVMILDGLRPKPHPTHFSTSECIEHLKTIAAKQSFITHLTHNWDHHQLQNELGDCVTVPWDGLHIEL